jgi:uncharacterized membrane protein
MCGVAFTILQLTIERTNPFSVQMKEAYRKVRKKGIFSVIFYLLAIPLAFINTIISIALFVTVAIAWLIPDRHIERAIKSME